MKNVNELHEQLKSNSTICAFHIGRGGRFNNQGFRRFLDFKGIGDYTSDLFPTFENERKFKDRFGFDSTGDNQRCILDLISDRDFDELAEKFGITEEMLGEEVYYDGGGNPVGLTVEEAETGIGVIDIDGDYDTTYTCRLTDCDEDELQLIKDSFLFTILDSDEQLYVNLSLGEEIEN